MSRSLASLVAGSLALLCLGGCAHVICATGAKVYGKSRDEIRTSFGRPKETDEDRSTERYRTRRKVADPMMPPGFDPTFGLAELPLVPGLLWDLQRQALFGSDLTVTYDENGRVVHAELDGTTVAPSPWSFFYVPPSERRGLLDDPPDQAPDRP